MVQLIDRSRPIAGVWSLEIVRYGAVGLFNTGFGYALFAGLYLLLGDRVPYLAILVVAFIVATSAAFLLHRRVTFRHRGPRRASALKFFVVNGGTLLANGLLLAAFVELAGMPVLLAQLLTVALVAGTGYLAHRYISFAPSGEGN